METWHIIVIVIAVALIIYFVMRRQTLPERAIPQGYPIAAAPGVAVTTGTVPNNPPLPTPPDAVAPPKATLARSMAHFMNPTTPIQNIPIVGRAVSKAMSAPFTIGFGAADKVNNALSHVPIVGKALAMPGKAVSSIAKKLNPFSW